MINDAVKIRLFIISAAQRLSPSSFTPNYTIYKSVLHSYFKSPPLAVMLLTLSLAHQPAVRGEIFYADLTAIVELLAFCHRLSCRYAVRRWRMGRHSESNDDNLTIMTNFIVGKIGCLPPLLLMLCVRR